MVTALFTLYHLPYAYLRWPSAGDLPAAFGAAAASGVVAGLPIAVVFWHSRGNLAAAIVLHACIDLQPAMRLVAHLLT
jgi:membrane protease YdiL (CAAX protease family)